MGYWVKDVQFKAPENLGSNQAFEFCCNNLNDCKDCPYCDYSLDCESACYLDCDSVEDIFKKFGYEYVEDNESQPQSKPEPNPDWPPICNYIGVPPETDFMFNSKTYRISLNGYICDEASIVTDIDLYGILNHPDKIIILAPLSEDDKAMVQQLYNAFGNVEIRKVADPNGNFSIWLTLDDGTSVQISNEYFKSLLSGRDYYLADLVKQIDQ